MTLTPQEAFLTCGGCSSFERTSESISMRQMYIHPQRSIGRVCLSRCDHEISNMSLCMLALKNWNRVIAPEIVTPCFDELAIPVYDTPFFQRAIGWARTINVASGSGCDVPSGHISEFLRSGTLQNKVQGEISGVFRNDRVCNVR